MTTTLNRCLVASDLLTWDCTYPSYFNEPEEYSNSCVRSKEASEFAWALQNLVKDQDDDEAASASIDAVEFMTQKSELSLSPDSEKSAPSKRQK